MSNSVELSIAKAINAGLAKSMRADEKVLVFGEDVARLGGVFRVTEGLLDEFGDKRIFNSPIAESGIVGNARGLPAYCFARSRYSNLLPQFSPVDQSEVLSLHSIGSDFTFWLAGVCGI